MALNVPLSKLCLKHKIDLCVCRYLLVLLTTFSEVYYSHMKGLKTQKKKGFSAMDSSLTICFNDMKIRFYFVNLNVPDFTITVSTVH